VRKILVVDDDAEVLDTTADYFVTRGFEVIRATNGLEALLQFKRERPDAVVLDLGMPRLGGLDALKRMLAFDPGVRVVVVTGQTDLELHGRARALGATAVLLKPVVLPDLLTALEARGEPPATAGGSRISTPPSPAAQPLAAVVGRVLVVDDDPDLRALLQELLSSKGYQARTAADSAAALRDIVQHPPDVVLLDIEMPGLRGVDALPAIFAVAPSARVIMVSGTADVEAAKRALSFGAFDYVVKPIDFAYLSTTLQTLMTLQAIERAQ
jgi:DNA-binding NtrC family response regulator